MNLISLLLLGADPPLRLTRAHEQQRWWQRWDDGGWGREPGRRGRVWRAGLGPVGGQGGVGYACLSFRFHCAQRAYAAFSLYLSRPSIRAGVTILMRLFRCLVSLVGCGSGPCGRWFVKATVL